MEKLLSIVVTTKNRKDTLFYSVKTALSIDWTEKEMEIIIQDCSGNDDAEKLIKESYNDDRIKYFRSPEGISMTENWNIAFGNAFGKYICIIGDDDGVLSVIKDVIIWANNNNIELISSMDYPRYYWPNFPDKRKSSLLFYKQKKISGEVIKFNAKKSLIESSYNISGKDSMLPYIYHGIITKRILNEIKKEIGCFTSTYIPDFYLKYASLKFVDYHYKLGFPLTIIGASNISNTAESVRNNNLQQKHIGEYKNYSLNKIFPNIGIAPVLCSETRYRAFENHGMSHLNKNFDFIKLYAVISIWFPDTFFKNLKKLQTIFAERGVNPVYGNLRYFILLVKRFIYKFISIPNDGTSYFSILKNNFRSNKLRAENISDACLKFQNEINFKGYYRFLKEIEK
jgi:hypothetical protein